MNIGTLICGVAGVDCKGGAVAPCHPPGHNPHVVIQPHPGHGYIVYSEERDGHGYIVRREITLDTGI